MHAPFTTLQTLGGFLLFGLQPWAPYMLNLIPLALLIFYCQRLVRGQNAWVYSSCLAMVFALPITAWTICQLRPDFPYAVVAAIAAAEALIPLSRGRVTLRAMQCSGLLIALCLFIKPAFFLMTFVLAAYLLGAGVLAIYLRRADYDLRELLIKAALPALGLVALFLISSVGRNAIAYVYDSMMTESAEDIWIQHTFLECLIRDTIGSGSYYLVGRLNVVLLGLLALVVASKIFQRAFTHFVVTGFGFGLISLLIVSKTGHPSAFFLMTFWLMALFILLFEVGDRQWTGWRRWLFTGGALVACLVALTTRHPFSNSEPKRPDPNYLIVEHLVELSQESGQPIHANVPLVGDVNDYELSWASLQLRLPMTFDSSIKLTSIEAFKQQLEGANVVIMPDIERNQLTENHSTYQLRAEIDQYLRSSGDWISAMTLEEGRQAWTIYFRRS